MAGGFAKLAHDSVPGGTHESSSWGVSWDTVNSRHKEDAAEAGAVSEFLNRTAGVDIGAGSPNHELVTVSGGNLALCLADPGASYLVWLDQGGSATLDLSEAPGTFSATRYAAANLTAPTDLPALTGGSSVSLGTTPETGFGSDYLFIVTSQ